MRDIARRLNISHATVSMALRNNPRISEKRRKEVRRIADEIGYWPDPVLSSLVAYRRGKQPKSMLSTLAWINRWKDPKQLRRYFEFDSYWKGAVSAAEKLGYKVEEFLVNPRIKGRRLNKILLARGIQGILVPPHAPDDFWRDLSIDWERFSIIRFGYSIADLRAHMVVSDQMRGAELAVQKIYEAGYRSVGFLSNILFDDKTVSNFRMGYLRGIEINEGMKRIEALLLPVPILAGEGSAQTREALRKWIEANQIEAIFTSEIGLAAILQELGIRVPQDVALASTSIHDCIGITAGLDQKPFEIGRVAVQVLVAMLNRNAKGEPEHCRRVLIDSQWVDGPSLPIKRTPLAGSQGYKFF